MKKIFLFFFTLSLIFITVSAKTETDLSDRLQPALDKIADLKEIPGLTFSVLIKGEKYINLASGYSDVENKIKMKAGDIMFSGSIGKTYAAAVIFQLMEEGKICFDDPVLKYFKEVKWLKRVPNIENSSIRMLLNHTTGIPRYAFHPSVWEEMRDNPEKVWSGKDRLEKVFDMKPLHEAGMGWAYSDTNYIILGMIIEKVTGNDYYSEMKKRCLLKYGHPFTAPADKRNLTGLVTGYCLVKELLLPEKVGVNSIFPINPQMEWTGGGVVTNSSDLVKWCRQFHSGEIFATELLAQIHKPAFPKTDLSDNALYGFATIIWNNEFGISYGHTGFFPGYVSIMQYYPKRDISLAMQINTDKLPEQTTIFKLLNRMAAIIFK